MTIAVSVIDSAFVYWTAERRTDESPLRIVAVFPVRVPAPDAESETAVSPVTADALP